MIKFVKKIENKKDRFWRKYWKIKIFGIKFWNKILEKNRKYKNWVENFKNKFWTYV